MLPKRLQFALRRDADFFSRAERRSTEYFTLFYTPTPSPEDGLQAAVIVPKKVCVKATQRNAVKRIMSSVLTEVSASMAAEDLPAARTVWSMKRPVTSDDHDRLVRSVTEQLYHVATDLRTDA